MAEMSDQEAEELFEAAKTYVDSWPWYYRLWVHVNCFFSRKRYWCLVGSHRWTTPAPPLATKSDPDVARVRLCERCYRIETRGNWFYGKWRHGVKGIL